MANWFCGFIQNRIIQLNKKILYIFLLLKEIIVNLLCEWNIYEMRKLRLASVFTSLKVIGKCIGNYSNMCRLDKGSHNWSHDKLESMSETTNLKQIKMRNM